MSKIISTSTQTGNVTDHGRADISGLHGALKIRGAQYGWTVTPIIDGAFDVIRDGSVAVRYETIK